MKKTPLLPAMGFLLLSLAACRKDRLPSYFGDISPYQIKTFYLALNTGDYTAFDTLSFSYDHYGNPTGVTRPQPRTGEPNFVFRYDKDHRLTEFIGAYSSPLAAEFVHKYFYNNKNLITLDSVYTLVSLTNGQPSYWSYSYARYLQYDHEDRVIRDSSTLAPSGFVNTYAYDGRGNLVNGATYDNKVNFRRTHWVWMFIDRDFSANNPFTATAYSNAGLPLHFAPYVNDNDNLFLYDNYYTEGWITYEHR